VCVARQGATVHISQRAHRAISSSEEQSQNPRDRSLARGRKPGQSSSGTLSLSTPWDSVSDLLLSSIHVTTGRVNARRQRPRQRRSGQIDEAMSDLLQRLSKVPMTGVELGDMFDHAVEREGAAAELLEYFGSTEVRLPSSSCARLRAQRSYCLIRCMHGSFSTHALTACARRSGTTTASCDRWALTVPRLCA
jgi:hypothetical protein